MSMGPRSGGEPTKKYQQTEKNPIHLTHLFQKPGRRALVDLFLTGVGDEEYLSKSDIAERLGRSRSTIIDHLPVLVRYGIVDTVEEGYTRYGTAPDNDTYQMLVALNQTLGEHWDENAHVTEQ